MESKAFVFSLRMQAATSSLEEWAALCAAVQQALEEFLNDIQVYLDTYHKASPCSLENQSPRRIHTKSKRLTP